MELGSEFDLDLSQLKGASDSIFEYLKGFRTIYTDSGRSALRLLSGCFMGKTILVPDYICGTVLEALPEGCKAVYYPVGRNFCIDMETLGRLAEEHSAQVLYLMHYFGTLQQGSTLKYLMGLKEEYNLTVIEDTTHSLFTEKNTVGDYCIASLRKWFPIPDGGVLYASAGQALPQAPREKKAASRKMEAMLLKKLYLTENFNCNAKYREIFTEEEERFRHQAGVYGISDMAYFLLSHFSVEAMCKRRRENSAQLLEGIQRLGYSAAVEVKPSDVLLAMPLYVTGRDRLRERLMERRVYCAVHWPLEHPAVYRVTRWIGDHILSLPMDQRYQKEGIAYLVSCLEACKREGGMP